jgi:dihydroorotase-like cyclic amidohydrolase
VTAGVDLIVRGGQVVTASDVVETAVAIKGDRIVALGSEALLPPADRVIDASGKYVLPGLIDCHLHIGPEYDDWKTAPLAAARTGLTTLLPFVVYDDGETLPKAVVRLREEAQALSVLDFGFHFILNHEPAILDGLPEAMRLGVTSFKLFMTYKKRAMVSESSSRRQWNAWALSVASASSTARTATSSATWRTRPSPRAARPRRTSPPRARTGRKKRRSTARSSSGG